MQHDMQHSLEKQRDFSYEGIISDEVKQVLNECDLVIGNLETTCSQFTPVSGFPKFNASPKFIDELAHTVDVFCLANNHIFDHELLGLSSTLSHLNKNAIDWVGVLNHPTIKVKDIIISNFTTISNVNASKHLVCQELPSAKIPEDTLGILIAHSGTEYSSKFTDIQKDIYDRARELGYRVIIQQHSHVIGEQKVMTNEIFAVNGMGNFISYQKNTLNEGVFFTLEFDGVDIKNVMEYFVKTEISNGIQKVIFKH